MNQDGSSCLLLDNFKKKLRQGKKSFEIDGDDVDQSNREMHKIIDPVIKKIITWRARSLNSTTII